VKTSFWCKIGSDTLVSRYQYWFALLEARWRYHKENQQGIFAIERIDSAATSACELSVNTLSYRGEFKIERLRERERERERRLCTKSDAVF
jgi:hypothetical protein